EEEEERRAMERGGRSEEEMQRVERVRQMECQLRDTIAHSDLAAAAVNGLKRELKCAFESKALSLARTFRDREEKREAKWKEKEEGMEGEKERIEQLRLQLERERKMVRKDETAKVKEWRDKYETEQRAHDELKKKYSKEQSLRRIGETKAKKEREETSSVMETLRKENERMKKLVEGQQRERAASRGQTAHRAALTRAENEAAAAPRRNGMQRTRYGSGAGGEGGEEKENVGPSAAPAAAAAAQYPQGILKNVRFADTTFTVQPPDDRMYEMERGHAEFGPYVRYANEIGSNVTVSLPDCGCYIFHYANGDARHIIPDESVKFHYLAGTGSVRIDFPIDRCQVRYFADGSLEILRSGKEITKCSINGDRTETIKRADGSIYAEIWRNNTRSIYDGKMGEARNMYHIGATVTHRACGSWVCLHSNNDLEFVEKSFVLTYYAATKNVRLMLLNQPTETQYVLHPSESGEILHVVVNAKGERAKMQCVDVGYQARMRQGGR
ncbi:hypothetical protein PFISCL1PPCAC_9466, partial [Pristionchus fissidentatus]